MEELGGLEVSFGADLSGLGAGIAASREQILSVATATEEASSSMEESLSGAETSFRGLATSAEESGTAVRESTSKSGGGLLDFASKAGMTYLSLQGLYAQITQVGGALLDIPAHEEQVRVAFDTLMHSTKAANQELDQLNKFAAKTPFQTDDIDTAAEKMLAFHFSARDVVPDLTAIGDTMSGLGKASGPDLNAIVDIFGKINAEGKLSGGVMMELSRWGVPAWQMLSEAMGKSVPELQHMVSRGLIPASQAIPMLTKGMEETFGGGMQKQSETFNGLMSTLESNIKLAWIAMSGPLFDDAKSALTDLGNLISSPAFAQFAQTVGVDVAAALQEAGGVIEQDIVPPLADLYNTVEPIIERFVAWNDKTHFLQNTLADVGGFIRRVGGDLDTNLLPPLKGLITTVGTAALNFADWLNKSGLLHDGLDLLGGVIDKTSGLVGTLVGWASWLIDDMNKGGIAGGLLKDALIGVGLGIAGIKIVDFTKNVFDMAGKAKDAVTSFLDLAGSIKDKLAGAIGQFKSKDSQDMEKGLDGIKGKAKDVATAEETVGTTAKEDMAKGVETGSTESEKSLDGIKTKSAEVEVAEEGIGTTAKGTMAKDVAIGSAEAETSIEGIATTAKETEAEVATASVGMEGSLGGVISKVGILGAALSGINIGEGSIQQPDQNSPTYQQEKKQWEHDHPGIPFPKQFLGFADGGITPGGPIVVGERGPEILAPPAGWHVIPNHHVAGGATASTGGQQLIQILLDNQVIGEAAATYQMQHVRLVTGYKG